MGVAAGITACSDDNPWAGESGQGGLRLNLATSAEVINARPQVRSGEQGPEAPEAENFSVKLEKNDGSYSKTWDSLSDFNNGNSFPTGSYILTAFYGDKEQEGFELPYFEGTANVDVLEARESEASVTASLANCMVSIDYTDAFKAYFSDYSTTVHSEGHSYVKFEKGETRPAYINPGEVDLTIAFTRPNGKSAQIQPASFAAEAKHHYRITFDVNNGEVGEAQLTIVFDESLVQEDVVIDLSDELFSSPAPSVNPSGFTNGQTIELLSQTESSDPLKFTVIARGGLQECNLTIASSAWTPAFGKEINLIEADAAQQSQIAESGIKVLGLYKNPDRMASVDISGLLANLPAGEYEISLQAKDKFTRVSDPVSVKLTCLPLELTVEPQLGVFGVPTGVFNVTYNGTNPNQDISFKALDQYGAWKEAPIVSVARSARTRAIESKTYVFTVTLPDAAREKIPVKVYLKGQEKAQVDICIAKPEFELQADAFSHQIVLKVNATDANMIPTLVNSLRIFANGTQVTGANLGHNSESGYIFVKGLNPSTKYTIQASLTNTLDDDTKTIEATTEATTDIVNGNFSQLQETINISSIQNGGQWSYLLNKTRTNTTSILVNEPTGWSSINSETCSLSANPMNTWFCVPSTMAAQGEVTLRSVAYDHNGTLPAVDKHGASIIPRYSRNTPSSFASKAAGELFYGTYANKGQAFSTRPSSVSFSYTYTPVGNEKAEAYVAVLDASDNVIAQGKATMGATSSTSTGTVALSSYPFGKKAAKLQIKFLSTSGSDITVPIPTDLADVSNITDSNKVIPTNQSKALCTGSVLKLYNVQLNY